MKQLILKKIKDNKEKVGILGLGYVGLPLAVSFAKKGVNVLGFEKNQTKIKMIASSKNYINDIDSNEFNEVVHSGCLKATSDFSRIKECDAIIICVPTPLDKFKKPDMSFIESACTAIGTYMGKGTFISLESTTYPTTTEDVMLPILERESNMKAGKDFWLAFSPERVDPGNQIYNIENTPKVIGAMTKDGLEIGTALYSKIINHLHTVSSPRVAEMVKILENTYRLINISLVNELALLAGKMDIDIWEVIEAAKTKPYGFQAFYPGPGVGGHCISLDPFYLEYIAKKFGFDLTMVETAGHIDNIMAHQMTLKIASALNTQKKSINGSKILFLGVAYKPNINDERESPALKIIDEVIKKRGTVNYYDPFISNITTANGNQLKSSKNAIKNLEQYDCVVITTKHSCFDAKEIKAKSKLIVDLQNMFKKDKNIYKL